MKKAQRLSLGLFIVGRLGLVHKDKAGSPPLAKHGNF